MFKNKFILLALAIVAVLAIPQFSVAGDLLDTGYVSHDKSFDSGFVASTNTTKVLAASNVYAVDSSSFELDKLFTMVDFAGARTEVNGNFNKFSRDLASNSCVNCHSVGGLVDIPDI